MYRLLIISILSIIVIFAGCGGDSGGGSDPEPEAPPHRLVVDTLANPTFTDVDEAVWLALDSPSVANVVAGEDVLYGRNSTLGIKTVELSAIKTNDTLYIRAKWNDASANLMGGAINKLSYSTSWGYDTYSGEDKFLMIFAKEGATNGADCSQMCHVTEHKTAIDTIDVWKWLSARTNPANLAEDGIWNVLENKGDSRIGLTTTDNVYVRNWNSGQIRPYYMHPDTTDFAGNFLYNEDTTEFESSYDWATGYKMPGYIIDSAYYNNSDPVSAWDVRAISEFDSTGAVSSYNWTVVFRRALNTGNLDDFDFTNLDSVRVAIAITHNDYTGMFSGAPIIPHSGSKPFWLILKP